MPLAIPIPLAFSRFKRLPQRAGEVWQGDIVRFPMWVEHQTDPDGPSEDSRVGTAPNVGAKAAAPKFAITWLT
jgi:hypothetical protein